MMLLRASPSSSGDGGPRCPSCTAGCAGSRSSAIAAFALLVGRLWQLQVMRGDSYYERTVSNVVKERYLPSVRGKILDRKGVPLADNRPGVQHLRDAEAAHAGRSRTSSRACSASSDDEIAKIDERLAVGTQARSEERRCSCSRIRAAIAPRSSSRRCARLPGVEVHHEPYRYYPQGDLAAHLVGYMTQMTADEADKLGDAGLRHERARRPLRPREPRGRTTCAARRASSATRSTRAASGSTTRPRATLIQGERVDRAGAGREPRAHDRRRAAAASPRRRSRTRAAAAVVVVEPKTGKIRAIVSASRRSIRT